MSDGAKLSSHPRDSVSKLSDSFKSESSNTGDDMITKTEDSLEIYSEYTSVKPLKRKRKNAVFDCDLCDGSYVRLEKLEEHMKSKHGNIIYFCNQCGKKYGKNNVGLYHHILQTHQKQEFHCDECNKEISTCGDLKMHKESVHDSYSYVCRKCGPEIMSYKQFFDHTSSAHAKKEFACDLCSYGTDQYKDYKEHRYLEHGKKYFVSAGESGAFLDETAGVVIQHDQGEDHENPDEKSGPAAEAEHTTVRFPKRAPTKSNYTYACDICEYKGTSSLFSI